MYPWLDLWGGGRNANRLKNIRYNNMTIDKCKYSFNNIIICQSDYNYCLCFKIKNLRNYKIPTWFYSWDVHIMFPLHVFFNSAILVARVLAIWTDKWFFSRVTTQMTYHFVTVVGMIFTSNASISEILAHSHYRCTVFTMIQQLNYWTIYFFSTPCTSNGLFWGHNKFWKFKIFNGLSK